MPWRCHFHLYSQKCQKQWGNSFSNRRCFGPWEEYPVGPNSMSVQKGQICLIPSLSPLMASRVHHVTISHNLMAAPSLEISTLSFLHLCLNESILGLTVSIAFSGKWISPGSKLLIRKGVLLTVGPMELLLILASSGASLNYPF